MTSQIKSVRINWDRPNDTFVYLATFTDGQSHRGIVDLPEDCTVGELTNEAESIAEELGGDRGQVVTLGMGNGCEWRAR